MSKQALGFFFFLSSVNQTLNHQTDDCLDNVMCHLEVHGAFFFSYGPRIHFPRLWEGLA